MLFPAVNLSCLLFQFVISVLVIFALALALNIGSISFCSAVSALPRLVCTSLDKSVLGIPLADLSYLLLVISLMLFLELSI